MTAHLAAFIASGLVATHGVDPLAIADAILAKTVDVEPDRWGGTTAGEAQAPIAEQVNKPAEPSGDAGADPIHELAQLEPEKEQAE
ncbi:MAG: hypothetical protein LAP40_16890 [Acidobacteriia bacterium]|nr:hypothetical protein [Terriglobia bacterium]